MVRLQKLLVKNFKLLHFDAPLVFPDGILAIQGLNEAGKSTILEAILYALYGRTIKAPRGEKKTLIRFNARTALVKLWIQVRGDTYLITRKLQQDRPTESTLHLVQPDGNLRRVATGVTTVDTEILKLLDGIRFEDLVASNIVAQKDLNRIAELGRSKRIQTIHALLNRGCFDKAVETLKQLKKDLEQTLDVEQKVLERLQSEAAAYLAKQHEQAQLTTKINQLTDRIESLSQLVEELDQHVTLLEMYRKADQQKKDLERSKAAENELLENAKANLDEIEQKEAELRTVRQSLDELSNVEEADKILKAAETRVTELLEMEPELRTLEKNIATHRQEIEDLEKFKDAEMEAKKTETHIETLESKKLAYLTSPTYIVPLLIILGSSLGLFIFDYTIGGAAAFLLLIGIGALFAQKVRSEWHRIDRLVKQAKGKLRLYHKQAAEYARKPDLEETLAALMLKLTHKNTQYSSLAAEAETFLTELPKAYRIFEEEDLKPRVRKVRNKIDDDKTQQKHLRLRAADLERDIAKKGAVQTEIETRSTTIHELNAQIREIEFPALPNGLIYSEETLNAKRDQYAATKTQLDTTIETRRMKQEQLDTVVAYLEEHAGVVEQAQGQEQKVTGLRLDIRVAARTIDCINKVAEDARKKVRPQAQIYMGRLLNKITNGKYKAAKLDEDYNLEVFSDAAGEFIDKALFSGGTEDQFLLGLRLAFALSILPQEKETHLEFIFLDEPFAGSDKERRANILDLLNEELLLNFKQVIIVSHQDDVLEASPHILRLDNGRIR